MAILVIVFFVLAAYWSPDYSVELERLVGQRGIIGIIFYVLIALVAFISYLTLTIAAESAKKLSHTILNIITRLMGLLLAAIGVQLILSALKIG